MSKARTFTKGEIADVISESSAHDMCAIFRPSGEIEVFPAIHSRARKATVDTLPMSAADNALDDWRAKHAGKNVRHS